MDSPNRIADRLRRTVHGPMWHGPSVMEAIGDLTAKHAATHVIPHAHSAWELVLHIAAWAEIAQARLDGEAWLTPTDAEDFPPLGIRRGKPEWVAAQRRVTTAYESLAAAVKVRSPADLDAMVVGQKYTAATMLHGVVEHGCYHAGQIVLMRKAQQA